MKKKKVKIKDTPTDLEIADSMSKLCAIKMAVLKIVTWATLTSSPGIRLINKTKAA